MITFSHRECHDHHVIFSLILEGFKKVELLEVFPPRGGASPEFARRFTEI